MILGSEIFVSLFEFTYDISVQVYFTDQDNCEFPFHVRLDINYQNIPGNAAFYLIFRILTLFLTQWVIVIVLLIRRGNRTLPDGENYSSFTDPQTQEHDHLVIDYKDESP